MSTTAATASRHYGVLPGHDLDTSVELPGWENESRWGWDPENSSFYAQLWRNTSDDALPNIWLSAAWGKHYPMPGCIVLSIAERTSIDPAEIVAALGLAHPNPTCRPHEEVLARCREVVNLEQDQYVTGQMSALGWVAGFMNSTAAGNLPWPENTLPTPVQVDAEQHITTGLLHRELDRKDFFSGVDEALWWALGR
jgi:hypothetical protein